MKSDRKIISNIIDEMLAPNNVGMYDTQTACDKLETYLTARIFQAIGWTHADSCVDLDEGIDPRNKNVGEMLVRAIGDLEEEENNG